MSVRRVMLTLCIPALSCCCSAAVWEGIGAGLQGAAGGAGAVPTASTSGKLMLFGGEGHKTYLGCLNCNKYASESVFNTYGSFGTSQLQRAELLQRVWVAVFTI